MARAESMGRDYAMNLAVLPAYREQCIELLRQRIPGLKIFTSSAHPDPTVTTGIPSDWFTRVWLARIGGSAFVQFGHWFDGLHAKTLVVDLNLRSLTAWVFLAIRAVARRRTLVWGHLHPQSGSESVTRGLRKLMRQLSSGVITYTYANARDALEESPSKAVWVAPNAIYSKRELEKGALDQGPRNTVLYVGRLEPSKKVDLLLQGFERSGLAQQGARLVVVGDGSEAARLVAETNHLCIESSVDFLGWSGDPESLRRLYGRAFCAASPGFAGLGLTQSQGFGVPMSVSRDEPHSPEIELPGTGGVKWCSSPDADDWGRALRDLFRARSLVPSQDFIDAIASSYSADVMPTGLGNAILDVDPWVQK